MEGKKSLISQKTHGLVIYSICFLLIAIPYYTGIVSGYVVWIPIGAGMALFLYSSITDHYTALWKKIPYSYHSAADTVVGAGLLASAYFIQAIGPLANFLNFIGGLLVIMGFLASVRIPLKKKD